MGFVTLMGTVSGRTVSTLGEVVDGEAASGCGEGDDKGALSTPFSTSRDSGADEEILVTGLDPVQTHKLTMSKQI